MYRFLGGNFVWYRRFIHEFLRYFNLIPEIPSDKNHYHSCPHPRHCQISWTYCSKICNFQFGIGIYLVQRVFFIRNTIYLPTYIVCTFLKLVPNWQTSAFPDIFTDCPTALMVQTLSYLWILLGWQKRNFKDSASLTRWWESLLSVFS